MRGQRRRDGAKAVILHLAADYPNANRRETTLAVRNFVQANHAVDHVVVALTRTADPRRQNLLDSDGAGDGRVSSMRYWGLPKGLLLQLSMMIVAGRVRRLLAQRHLTIDLIHAHKLCYEGIAGYYLSRRLGVPLVCSVRGDSERLTLKFLPHYLPLYRRIAQYSQRLYYVSAWIRPVIERRLGAAHGRGALLPNFCDGTSLAPVELPDADRLVTILHLDVYAKKGLDRLLAAFAQLAQRHPDVTLDIIGRGTPASIRQIEALIDAAGVRGRARLLGPLPRAELLAKLLLAPGGEEAEHQAFAQIEAGRKLATRDSFFRAHLESVAAEIYEARAKRVTDPAAVKEARKEAIRALERAIAIDRHLQRALLALPDLPEEH